MQVFTITGGSLAENCHFFTIDDIHYGCVDPGFIDDNLLDFVNKIGTENLTHIFLTHGHYDHITGVAKLVEMTGATVFMYEDEIEFITDHSKNLSMFRTGANGLIEPFSVNSVADNEIIPFYNSKIKVMHTPGHTKGGCCYIIENTIFTGDTLMKGGCGRYDLPTASREQIKESLRKLKSIDGNYNLYCGHGDNSTLDWEKQNNRYFLHEELLV